MFSENLTYPTGRRRPAASPVKFRDLSVAIPAFLTIIAMPLTFNIATGFGFGFISFVVLRVLTGRRREVSPIMYIVAICFAANFALRG